MCSSTSSPTRSCPQVGDSQNPLQPPPSLLRAPHLRLCRTYLKCPPQAYLLLNFLIQRPVSGGDRSRPRRLYSGREPPRGLAKPPNPCPVPGATPWGRGRALRASPRCPSRASGSGGCPQPGFKEPEMQRRGAKMSFFSPRFLFCDTQQSHPDGIL